MASGVTARLQRTVICTSRCSPTLSPRVRLPERTAPIAIRTGWPSARGGLSGRVEAGPRPEGGLEAAEATRRVVKTEERLRALQRDLEDFNRDVLGGRKERLAAVIEDVYALTEKAGTVPGQISYSFDEVGAATRLALSFNVQGRYADIKKLLFSFESNPRFLLPENVALATDDSQPDVLRLNLSVAHYFRPDGSAAPRRVTRAARGADRTGAAQAGGTAATPAAARGVPE